MKNFTGQLIAGLLPLGARSSHAQASAFVRSRMARSSLSVAGTVSLRMAGWLVALVLSGVPAGAAVTNHVVILVMDGARYTETWGDPAHANIPQIATNLARRGVVLTNFYTDITLVGGATETNPGHATLACGAYQDIANDGTELPNLPTLFQYYRQQKAAPSNSVWVVTSKDKLVVLADSAAAGWNNQFRPRFSCGVNGDGTGGYRADSLTHAIARAVLTNDRPAVMIINYKDPDSMGHANNWSGYLAAIKTVDGYAADLWAIIQADPVLKDTTTLFITNDHGRHTSNFVSHGDACEGCRHLLCVVVGPGLKTNHISGIRRTQPDIARTAADLLTVTMPTATGQVMSELYQPPEMLAQTVAANGTLVISWPAAGPGYTLRVNSDLSATGWTVAPEMPQPVGLQMQVVVSPTNGRAFYRLGK